MTPILFVLWGVLAPAVLAGVLLLLGAPRSTAPQDGARPQRAWTATLAFGAGCAVGHAATLGGPPPLPPVSATQVALLLPLLAAAIGLATAPRAVPRALAWVLRAGLCALVPWWLLRQLAKHWEPRDAWPVLAGSSLALGALWWGLEAWARRRRGASVPLVAWLVSAGGAAALILSRSAMAAQFATTLAGVCGAAVVVAWMRPGLSLAGGAMGVAAVVLAGVWLAGAYLAELPPAAAALLAAAPLAAWLGETAPVRRLAAWQAAAARLGMVLVPVAVALWLAWRAAPEAYEY